MAEGGGEKGWLPLTQAHVIHPPDFFSFLQAEQVPDCDPEMGRPMCMRTHTHTHTDRLWHLGGLLPALFCLDINTN